VLSALASLELFDIVEVDWLLSDQLYAESTVMSRTYSFDKIVAEDELVRQRNPLFSGRIFCGPDLLVCLSLLSFDHAGQVPGPNRVGKAQFMDVILKIFQLAKRHGHARASVGVGHWELAALQWCALLHDRPL
jgi:hypothetical protein